VTRPSVVINAYNSAQVFLIGDRIASRLRPGDAVALVNGNGGHPFEAEQLRLWVGQLAPRLPQGVTLAHHTSGLANVQTSASSSPAECSSLLYDYEPNFEPEFSWDFSSCLTNFRRFADISRGADRIAVGYPTGRAILENGLQAYQWDYGQLRACVDRLIVQTQHWAHVSADVWSSALSKLQVQYEARGFSADQLFPQVSIGGGPNSVDEPVARGVLEEAQRRNVAGIYIWWSPEAISGLESLLD
jgi:hypothetical protein